MGNEEGGGNGKSAADGEKSEGASVNNSRPTRLLVYDNFKPTRECISINDPEAKECSYGNFLFILFRSQCLAKTRDCFLTPVKFVPNDMISHCSSLASYLAVATFYE